MINVGTKQLNPYQKSHHSTHNTPATTTLLQTQEYLTTNTDNLSVRTCSVASFCSIYYLNFFHALKSLGRNRQNTVMTATLHTLEEKTI